MLYRRRIPVLITEHQQPDGELPPSARVCGNNQKRCTPGFTAFMVRGFVLMLASPVGWKQTLTQILPGARCYAFLDYPDAIHASMLYQTFVRAVRLTGLLVGWHYGRERRGKGCF